MEKHQAVVLAAVEDEEAVERKRNLRKQLPVLASLVVQEVLVTLKMEPEALWEELVVLKNVQKWEPWVLLQCGVLMEEGGQQEEDPEALLG